MAAELGISDAELQRKVDALREFNPMLGHRGCRLAITYPEIYQMQVRAIFEAAVTCARDGVEVHPEVMIPLVTHAGELEVQMSDPAVAKQAGQMQKIAKELGRLRPLVERGWAIWQEAPRSDGRVPSPLELVALLNLALGYCASPAVAALMDRKDPFAAAGRAEQRRILQRTAEALISK